MSDVVYPTDKKPVTGNLNVPKDQSSINGAYVTGTDSIEVDSGGTASDLAVILGGTITINDVSITNLSAIDGGTIVFNTSGTINELIVSGGYVSGTGGATINQPTVNNPNNQNGGGYLVVYDGTVNGGIVSDGGTIVAKNADTVVSGITVNSGGQITVENGTATDNTVSGAGAQITISAGSATGTTVNSGGDFHVLANGSANNTKVDAGGDMSAWGKVSNTTVDGNLTVLDGGITSRTTVNGGASLYVNGNASAYDNTIDGGNVFVSGVVSGGTLTDNGQILVSAGGVVSSIEATSANLWISAGGSAVDTTVDAGFTDVYGTFSGGSIYNGLIKIHDGGVASGVSASGTDFSTQGTIEVDGGTVIDPITHDYGNVTLNSGTVENLLATGGGITMNGGTLSGGTFQSGATMTVSAGVVSSVANIGNGGHANVSGGTVSNLNIEAGGSGAITGGSVADATVSSGGTLNFDAGATLTDTLTLSSGGTATITGNTGGTVQLGDGYTSGLTITGAGTGSDNTVTTTISGWTSSSQIDLKGVRFDDASYTVSNGTVVVTSDLEDGTKYTVTLDIPGATKDNFKIINDNQGGTILICFLAGSMIRTPNGAVVVEDIQIGDQVVTFDWKNNKDVTRAVVWAGKAHCTVRPELSDDAAGWPVRILKDAIADGVPYKDMLITSEHCLFFDGKFVPARMLVNGASIFYDKSITSYDYYHVETEQHSVITADGMLTESYLDTGNRSSFRQEGNVVRLGGQKRTWADHAGAPLCVERSFVEPLFRALELRENCVAGCRVPTESIETTLDPDLHLVTDTKATIRSMRHKGQQHSFMLPPETKSVRLVSRASRPADVIGPFVDDRRSMGVAVADVHLLCAKHTHDITSHLQAEKPEGWHETDWTDCAWTNGNAVLPLGDYLINGKMGILSMIIRAAGPYSVQPLHVEKTKVRSA